jgi:hypothetical protein
LLPLTARPRDDAPRGPRSGRTRASAAIPSPAFAVALAILLVAFSFGSARAAAPAGAAFGSDLARCFQRRRPQRHAGVDAFPDRQRASVTTYMIERAPAPGGPWTFVDSVSAVTHRKDDQGVHRDTEYYYRITALGPGGVTPALSVTGPVVAKSEWLNDTRWSVMVAITLFFGFVLYFFAQAQSGKKPFVRRIRGIDAIEEAVGRATEMGRSVLYITGIRDIDDIQTVAGLVILESVARMTARYQTTITVPVSYPIPSPSRRRW